MTNTLYNLARMTTTTTGTGTVSLLSAVSGYLSFEDAGVQDADVVTYAIHEGSNSEVGQGTYTSSGATLSRDTVYASTNNGAQITLSGNAQVFITASAEDFASLVDASGTPSDSQIAVWTDANTIEGASSLTYDGTTLTANGTLKLQEAAAAAADTAGYGQIWVKNDSPSTLWYTDDAGTDYEIGTGAGGTVDVSGTPVNDQIAIWTDADTLEGQSALTFTSGVLQVGSGDSGATIASGADNVQIKTSATADIGMTISDAGTASLHSIEFRTSDDDYGYIQVDHDATAANAGVVIGYNDGTSNQRLLIDYKDDAFEYTDQGGTTYNIVLDTATQTLTNKTIQGGTWTSAGSTATTSGTTVDVTGIPSWVTEIVVVFDGVSTNGTDPWLIQLGDSGGIEATGYIAHSRDDTAGVDSTAGFVITDTPMTAADAGEGMVRMFHAGGNKWAYESHIANASDLFVGGGTKTTSGTVTQLRLTTTGGTNTFDAGQITVKYS